MLVEADHDGLVSGYIGLLWGEMCNQRSILEKDDYGVWIQYYRIDHTCGELPRLTNFDVKEDLC